MSRPVTTKLTDYRKAETLVHYGCRGEMVAVHRGLFTEVRCLKCGATDVRALEIVRREKKKP